MKKFTNILLSSHNIVEYIVTMSPIYILMYSKCILVSVKRDHPKSHCRNEYHLLLIIYQHGLWLTTLFSSLSTLRMVGHTQQQLFIHHVQHILINTTTTANQLKLKHRQWLLPFMMIHIADMAAAVTNQFPTFSSIVIPSFHFGSCSSICSSSSSCSKLTGWTTQFQCQRSGLLRCRQILRRKWWWWRRDIA